MLLTWKNLVKDPVRLAISLSGVSIAVILILVMTGIFFGTINQVTTYIDNTEPDLWIMQEGINQMFRSVSVLPSQLETQLESQYEDEITDISSILGVPSSFDYDDQSTAFYLVGYDHEEMLGSPWLISEGVSEPQPQEAIFDSVLARKNGIEIGDDVDLLGEVFTVVGISEETAAVGNFYVFINMSDAERLFRRDNAISFMLLSLNSNIDVISFQSEIKNDYPELEILTTEEFSKNSRDIVVSMLGRPLYVMIAISVVVGIAIVALTVFTSVTEQLVDYSIIKAIGARTIDLYTMVVQQAIILGVGGYILGSIVAYLAQFVIRERLGDIIVEISPRLLLLVFGLTLIMCILSSLIPVRRIVKIDPAVAFKR